MGENARKPTIVPPKSGHFVWFTTLTCSGALAASSPFCTRTSVPSTTTMALSTSMPKRDDQRTQRDPLHIQPKYRYMPNKRPGDSHQQDTTHQDDRIACPMKIKQRANNNDQCQYNVHDEIVRRMSFTVSRIDPKSGSISIPMGRFAFQQRVDARFDSLAHIHNIATQNWFDTPKADCGLPIAIRAICCAGVLASSSATHRLRCRIAGKMRPFAGFAMIKVLNRGFRMDDTATCGPYTDPRGITDHGSEPAGRDKVLPFQNARQSGWGSAPVRSAAPGCKFDVNHFILHTAER